MLIYFKGISLYLCDIWQKLLILKKVLNRFAAELAAGKSIDKLSHSEIINGEFRYMQAIGMGEACTACHGQDIKPEVKTVIDQKYPYDEATGFTVGDLRGAFSLRRAVQ